MANHWSGNDTGRTFTEESWSGSLPTHTAPSNVEYLNIRTENSVEETVFCVCLAPVTHVCVTLCDYRVTAGGFWFTAEYTDNKACSKSACTQKMSTQEG